VIHRKLFGVSVGGVPWKVGRYCLYRADADNSTRLGKVVTMFLAKDDMDDNFVVFQVENKPITTYMGHYCMFSDDQPTTVFVLWTKITWMCKILKVQGGQADMALPYVPCTSRELMEFG
jgi:hypothetical protein